MNRTKEGASKNEARLREKDDQVGQALAIGVPGDCSGKRRDGNVYRHFG